jgi:hypothetical protein
MKAIAAPMVSSGWVVRKRVEARISSGCAAIMQTHFVPPASIPANKSVMAISVYMLRGGEFCSLDYIHYILLNQDLQKIPSPG